jgi:outer membrane receptor protein involved in Fe transport
VEVEVRKAVAYTSSSAFLNNLSVIFNAAAIWSEIDLGDQVTLTEAAKRPMQGQSPYIINAGLYYQNDKSGWQVSTQYNVFGKRIAFVGDREFPTQWEMPRHVIDLTIAKRLTEKTELRLGISDLLNAEAYFREDANLDNSVTSPDSDRTIRSTRFGQYVTLGIALRL